MEHWKGSPSFLGDHVLSKRKPTDYWRHQWKLYFWWELCLLHTYLIVILCALDWLEKEYFKSLIKNQIREVCRWAHGTRLEKSVWRMYLIWVVQYICSCGLLATKWVLTFGRDAPLTNWKQILFLFSSAFEISFEINNERAFLHSVSNESEQREGLGTRIALIKYSCSVCRWCHYPALYTLSTFLKWDYIRV